ncbi:MAG: Rpn family recombination-promoting nuclease/putative transposase [Bacteroidales bacterium]
MSRVDKYVNPLTDFGFKKLFGTEQNKDIMIDFLNTFLPEHRRVRDISYKITEHLPDLEIDRKSVFDIYCESHSGERFIVEMQKARQRYFKERSVFYSTFPIQEQACKGAWDYRLDAVYSIGILNFIFDAADTEFVHDGSIRRADGKGLYDKLHYIFIELPKFTKTVDKLETMWDKWLFTLRNLASLQERPAALQERVFEKIFEIAEIAKFTHDEWRVYEDSLKTDRDNYSTPDTAREEGEKIGIEKGRKLERTETRGKEKNEIALRMIAKGYDNATTHELTGLSIEEIEKLRRSA